jgi:ADP-heptose:LPS heptosyltransferase
MVAMHIGGAMRWNRRWPIENYLEICARLSREFEASIVLIGGDEEKAEVTWLSGRLKQIYPEARVIDFVGCSINRMLKLFSQADLYIGNDSGPMHLAVSVGLPVVAVFGPSDHHYAGPDKVDFRHQVVKADFPCSQGKCQLGCRHDYDIASPDYPACMKELPISSVWAAVTRALCFVSSLRPRCCAVSTLPGESA